MVTVAGPAGRASRARRPWHSDPSPPALAAVHQTPSRRVVIFAGHYDSDFEQTAIQVPSRAVTY